MLEIRNHSLVRVLEFWKFHEHMNDLIGNIANGYYCVGSVISRWLSTKENEIIMSAEVFIFSLIVARKIPYLIIYKKIRRNLFLSMPVCAALEIIRRNYVMMQSESNLSKRTFSMRIGASFSRIHAYIVQR